MPHLPRLIMAIHMMIDSGRFGIKQTATKKVSKIKIFFQPSVCLKKWK
jgi:hypothetical protein